MIAVLLPFVVICPMLSLPAQQAPTGPQPAPARAAQGANPYAVPDWHADWPVALDLPLRSPGRWYDRTRRQALERVVANLQGNVRRDVWLMATEFFDRAPADAVPALITAMDRAFANPATADVVRNTLDAMGRMADERCDDAIRRALEHPGIAVRQAAYAALTTSGKVETIKSTAPFFLQMDGRARASWLRAARLRLGADAVPLFTELMMAEMPVPLRDAVLKEALEMPPEQAVAIVRGRWHEAVGEFQAIIAGLLHATGDLAGTTWLQHALRSEDPAAVVLGVKNAGRWGRLGVLQEDVLKTVTHARSEVRLELLMVLKKATGDDIDKTLEVLADPGEDWQIKGAAIQELTRRGRTQSVDALLDEVATTTGTRLTLLLNLLAVSGDPRAVPLFVERFGKAPAGEGREFLQALAFSGSAAAADALLAIFRGEERAVQERDREGGQLTTWNYVPILLPNLRGAEHRVLAGWGLLARDDWRRRSLLLQAIAGIAADRTDPKVSGSLWELVRSVVFDKAELPQLRMQALQSLARRAITIDDAMNLREQTPTEAPPMRAFFSDWLLEYF